MNFSGLPFFGPVGLKKPNTYIYTLDYTLRTSKYISFLLLFQDGEKLSNKVSGERRSSAIANKGLKIGNSHTSVIGGLHVLQFLAVGSWVT